MSRVLVLHTGYGCDTGCCGHAVEVDDKEVEFFFTHPYQRPIKDFVKELVIKACGEEHVKDIDWDNCIVLDD
jgi:hypothetical protein